MSDVGVFLCFDVENDVDLSLRMREDAERGGSGFYVTGQSAGGSCDERWSESTRARIRASDQVIVICGEHSAESVRMKSELEIVQAEGKAHFLVWGRRDRMCAMPKGAARDASMYSWTFANLIEQVSATLSNARPMAASKPAKKA